MSSILSNPWERSSEEVLSDLDVMPDQGLSSAEAGRRRRKHGENRLRKKGKKSAWLILINQFESLVIIILAAASVLSLLFGKHIESVAIGAAIVINAAIGFFTELKAARMMESLRQIGMVSTKVRRDGNVMEIKAEKVVPGDIVIIEGGDIISADMRLLEASKLQTDESALTGESVPVSKNTNELEGDVLLAERINMVFKGTSVTTGSGEGVVTATGMNTELGRISSLVQEAEDEITPLEKRLNRLGQRLIWITVAIAVVVAAAGIFAGKELLLMVEVSVALAVAAIPEGLPIVATIALAKGMLRMASRNALVNRLSAVETLGATTIIFTDKTGTLTENRLMVKQFVSSAGVVDIHSEQGGGVKFLNNGQPVDLRDSEILTDALKIGMMCSNATLADNESGGEMEGTGDPLEIALLILGHRAGYERSTILKEMPETREEAFDTETMMMATFHETVEGYYVAVKGAPEALLNSCTNMSVSDGREEMTDENRREWTERNRRMAEEGMRVLALAEKTVRSEDVEPYKDLTFVALVGLFDPPRHEAKDSIASCRDAGIKVAMVTGDQPVTARIVGSAVGIIDEDNDSDRIMHGSDIGSIETLKDDGMKKVLAAKVFSRVSPEQKLDIISAHQRNGEIVAMTGDGVNDAPALKKADIGIAMGKRGTQVAREAADMVLRDDAFSTIVSAVEHGRLIFNNIRKFVLFLLSGNVSEIIAVSAATTAGMPLPILPLQILFLNMVIDVFPALALGLGEGDPSIMKNRPRDPREPFLTQKHWIAVAGYGIVISLTVVGMLWTALYRLDIEKDQAITISFLTLAFARLWHVFNMRDAESEILVNDITRNPYVWGAIVVCMGLIMAVVYFPPLAEVLNIHIPDMKGWFLTTVSLVPLIIIQVWKYMSKQYLNFSKSI